MTKPMTENRKDILLKACMELLQKQDNSVFVLNLLEENVFYDDANCDGFCLLDDIKAELNLF